MGGTQSKVGTEEIRDIEKKQQCAAALVLGTSIIRNDQFKNVLTS
jgi:hypothetical protein